MSDILEKICTDMRAHVEKAKIHTPLDLIHREALRAPPPRGFARALRNKCEEDGVAFIAEIKKSSPTSGLIRDPFSPKDLAHAFEKSGAACLSVMTNEAYFQGYAEDLIEAREACSLPVLRKDFLLDVWQVAEARTMGADCITLIMAALDDTTASLLHQAAMGYGMDVVIEVHNREELTRALKLPSRLIAINSRNMNTLKVDIRNAAEIAREVPLERFVIGASGIHTKADVIHLHRAGARGFLVGEALLKQPDAGKALRALRGV